jgi:hypothetical protein
MGVTQKNDAIKTKQTCAHIFRLHFTCLFNHLLYIILQNQYNFRRVRPELGNDHLISMRVNAHHNVASKWEQLCD